MNYIILDLEATCKENDQTFENEIIEIGAVKINSKLETVDEFSQFLKPVINPILTPFCTKLTTIKQSDVDSAKHPIRVIQDFIDWCSKDNYLISSYLLCSWGFYDKKQFKHDCNYHRLNTRWLNNHISLKHQFAEIKNIRPCGMGKALSMLKLPLEGTHHRGIDDAKNIAKIFKVCSDQWDLS